MKTMRRRVMAFVVAVLLTVSTVIGDVNMTVMAEEASTQISVAEFNYSSAPENAPEGKVASATAGSGSISVVGATFTGYQTSGLTANSWAKGSSWVIEVNGTEAFQKLSFTAEMRATATAPANWKLSYFFTDVDLNDADLNAADWNDAYNYTIAASDAKNWKTVCNQICIENKELNDTVYFKLTVTDKTAVNGFDIQGGGNVNLNKVVVQGISGDSDDSSSEEVPSNPEEAADCAKVTVSPEAGEVEEGTAVTLSTATVGAAIYYNTNGTNNYDLYTEAIVITEDTTIWAYASKEDMNDSERSSFAYSVKHVKETEETEETEVEETEVEEETVCAHLYNQFADGAEILIYYPDSKLVLGKNASGSKLAGSTAEPTEENEIAVTDDMALLQVKLADAENGYYTLSSDGKYLTSGATGNSLTYQDSYSDYALWMLESNDTGVYIVNANAKYGSSNQYMEYYNGFTTYSYKAASDVAYRFEIYAVKEGKNPEYTVDESVTVTVSQWAGNANYEDSNISASNVIYGDLYATNDMLDTASEYIAVVGGEKVLPYTKATSTTTGSTSYYMGGTGLGSGSNDYIQMKLSSLGYGNLSMSFRMRASNTAPGSFQLQYSTDGVTFDNFTTGTYAYAYTAYGSDGSSTNVSKSGEITDGIAKTSLAPTYYVSFTFDVPREAANAEELYIRMVPGSDAAKSGKNIAAAGVIRVDSVVISGNPVVNKDITSYVTASPMAGEVAIGSTITLSSKTEGATIYYAINGSDYQVYDENNKPVLSELPACVETYAKKDGLNSSIKMVYQYKQAQCAAVKATPNGGAVVKNAKVTLKTETEDATILYAFGEGSDELEWLTYSSQISLTELPCVISVKVVKEGYLDSPVSTLSFTEKTNEKYNIYFGQIHAHTNYSDGSGSVEEAFEYARNVDNLDFLAVTDHSNSLDNAANSVISKNVDTADTDEWTKGHSLAKQYTTDEFTCIYGYEMTWSNGLGHINTFNTPGFQSRTQTEYATYSTALQNYYVALNTVPDSISQFNHPGTTFGDFSDFAYYSEANDTLITLIEVGNGEGTIGSSGYFPSYEYYTRALDKGWHVAPSNNQDNHKGKWGDANTARTVVLADSNTEANIYDAMRNYRVYATEDNNLSIYYTLDDYLMGTILEEDQVGNQISIKAEIKDADANDRIGKVEVIVNGGLSIASKTVNTNEETVTFEVPSNYSYYYLKITEADGDIAVTSPVWVGTVEACGVNKTYTNTVLPVQGEAFDLNVDFYNNEQVDLVIDRIAVKLKDAEGNYYDVCDVTGEEANVAKVSSNGTATFTKEYTYQSAGKVTYEVTVEASLNGVSKVYTDKLDVNYVTSAMVTNVIIDGTHFNDYVSGYYGGNVGSFISICADNNIKAEVALDEISADALKDCALLILSAPAKKKGTANAGDYTVSHYSDEFLAMVKEYVANGGSVIVCGLADYSDSTDCQTATEQNKLLEAIGATIRMNSDEVYDEVNNGGQPYRLYPTNFNMDSKYLAGVVEGQTYSQYSGCSVDVSNAVETDLVYAAEALVSGFETTYSIDCKDNGVSAGNKANDNKGNVTFLAHQSTKAGGDIFVAGGVFLSDFEVKAEIDNNDSLPYANYNIIKNIINDKRVVLPTSTIAEARQGAMGDVFAVEGYVTSGTSNENTTFFDTIYIQDETAGIDIFPYAESGLEIGTKMRIVGFVSEYQGDRELKVISYEILDDAPYVFDAKVVSTKDATDYANLGGSLLKTSGKVTRVEYGESGTVSEFWLVDETGVEAAIFIDGYIYSGTTGKNELAEFVKVGSYVEASGVLYMHPEGDSDVSVPVFRVRDCDDIAATTKPEVSIDWVSGNYSQSKPVINDNASRISLKTPLLVVGGNTYEAKISNGEFRLVVREWNTETKKMASIYLTDGVRFTAKDNCEYYVTMYSVSSKYKNITFEEYVAMLTASENPLTVSFLDVTEKESMISSTFTTGQEASWISGNYGMSKIEINANAGRISMTEALQVTAGETYQAAISLNGNGNRDFRYIVREKNAEGKVVTFYLNDQDTFTAKEGSAYYVTVYSVSSAYKNMDFEQYVALAKNQNLVFDFMKVNE